MNPTGPNDTSSSANSISSVWKWLTSRARPWIGVIAATVSVLSALYITAAIGGATNANIEHLNAAWARDQIQLIELNSRLGNVEGAAVSIKALTDHVLDMSRILGRLEGMVDETNANVRVLLTR